MVFPGDLYFPTLVFERGWSEGRPRLMDGMNLWLVGSNGGVNAVILLKWSQDASSMVHGGIELYTRGRDGIPARQQSEV